MVHPFWPQKILGIILFRTVSQPVRGITLCPFSRDGGKNTITNFIKRDSVKKYEKNKKKIQPPKAPAFDSLGQPLDG